MFTFKKCKHQKNDCVSFKFVKRICRFSNGYDRRW